MSMLDFIAFPREADDSCIKNFAGDKGHYLKGASDKYGNNDYLKRPSNIALGSIGISEKWEYEPFKRVFKNKFVYRAFDCFGNFERCESMVIESGIDRDELYYYSTLGAIDLAHFQKGKNRKGQDVYALREQRDKIINRLKEIDAEFVFESVRCIKQFYDLIVYNTKAGEAVEVYTCWLSAPPSKLPKPKEIRIIDTGKVLFPDAFYCKENVKTEIWNL